MKDLRRTLINANALLTFEAAGRLESFTRAAEELGVSQPAVTRQVRALEAAVGAALFTRRHNRVALTPDGRRLWAAASTGFDEMARVMESIRRGGERGRLTFALHSGAAQQWLMPRFSDLRQLFDGMEVQLMLSDSTSEMEHGGYDAALRVCRLGPVPPGERRRLLITEQVQPVASPGFLADNPEAADCAPEDLVRFPLLHMDEGDRLWLTWSGWFRLLRLPVRPPRPGVFYANYPLVIQEALAGRGIALAWRPLTDALAAQGALIPVGPMVENREAGYCITWPADGPAAHEAARLADWFEARFGVDETRL